MVCPHAYVRGQTIAGGGVVNHPSYWGPFWLGVPVEPYGCECFARGSAHPFHLATKSTAEGVPA